ncbi:peroxiredoxin [Flexivirga endophytica]|uniref:Alkyl hydroperoxide reductase E n=1 Tax=Flexivirga endophytica TaxID=1849103 RepID=A0A916WZB8_9MICO|nr:peroxiredoxin [Flexivirga endophytica]GGB41726.1 peroxiredoxin [Flexivirga endophytica]GHB69561.1 peroxiredoxin [Flexivirga endophytica]
MTDTRAAVGDMAPDFTLQNQHGESVSLRERVADKPVLLVFYPFAWSGICTGELCGIRDDIAGFTGDGRAEVLAISCDPMFTLRAWSEAEHYDFDLLSDFWPHGEVASAYGVFNGEAGMAIRGTFLVDGEGTIRWSQVNGPGEARDFEGYRDALAAL